MFPCTGCGLCCQNISKIKELKGFDLGNGVCKHFNIQNNSCDIYKNRPSICKVAEIYELSYSKYFTKNEFFIENAKVCNSLQEQYKLDKSFKVIIGD
ncbi:MAG TPA: YkgJ family cysteine cluster protein [Sulfurimonas autotrophica]|nr:YkgJ family cysteine cluster protein [Sulfurimonas autotrophica]